MTLETWIKWTEESIAEKKILLLHKPGAASELELKLLHDNEDRLAMLKELKKYRDKDNKTMTNAEKFKETFGFDLDPMIQDECPLPPSVCKNGCCNCVFDHFWKKEYKSCFRLGEE